MSRWQELPIGGAILEPGNMAQLKTHGWRAFRPVINQDKCTRCYICWMYCPDNAIFVIKQEYRPKGKNIKFDVTFTVDYDHCKGCGICANECPVKAIDMVREYE